MPNPQKQQTVSELRAILSRSKGAVLTDYRGLTVAEVSVLRTKLRAFGAEYHIVKNTLFKVALGGKIDPELDTLLNGPTAIAFMNDELAAPTKTVIDFLASIKKPEIQVKGGYIDGKVYTTDQVKEISKLPPRDILVAQLIGTLNGPVSSLVGTLDGIIAEFVRTIQSIADKQTEGAAPAA